MQVAKLPGVTSRNVFGLLNRASDLRELVDFGEDELEEAMGSRENALLLHKALHQRVKAPTEGEGGGTGSKPKRQQGGKRFKSAAAAAGASASSNSGGHAAKKTK